MKEEEQIPFNRESSLSVEARKWRGNEGEEKHWRQQLLHHPKHNGRECSIECGHGA